MASGSVSFHQKPYHLFREERWCVVCNIFKHIMHEQRRVKKYSFSTKKIKIGTWQ